MCWMVPSRPLFLSTLSLRRATFDTLSGTLRSSFLSTLSLRRATSAAAGKRAGRYYFYPRSPCGERPDVACGYWHKLHHFYPRSPCGERHNSKINICYGDLISIHALLAESDTSLVVIGTNCIISIHALLAESDRQRRHCKKLRRSFLSTLSLRRATFPVSAHRFDGGFLSTLSLRRATGTATRSRSRSGNFYPRSPCGERLHTGSSWAAWFPFLSTLSLRRATCSRLSRLSRLPAFLSTLSLRRATILPL